jgi:hypothetical protein
MNPSPVIDEALAARLPLPVAQLYRAAHNTLDPFIRHQASYYIWEASIKLLAAAALSEHLRRPTSPPPSLDFGSRAALPLLGQWGSVARTLVATLAEGRDPGFEQTAELLFRRPLRQGPRALELDQQLRQQLAPDSAGRGSTNLAELFERLVSYRNRVIGHGAICNHPPAHYERVGAALLGGLTEILGSLRPAAGRCIVHIAEVRKRPDGWEVVSFALTGEVPHILSPWCRPKQEGGVMPDVGRLYLTPESEAPPDPASLVPLHPLLRYDAETREVLFLNAGRGKQRLEYLNYNDGRTVEQQDDDGSFPRLLASVTGRPVEDLTPDEPAPAPPAPRRPAPASGTRQRGKGTKRKCKGGTPAAARRGRRHSRNRVRTSGIGANRASRLERASSRP